MTQIYLDTHIAIWLAQKKFGKLSKKALVTIENADLIHLPAMAELELQILSELGKIKVFPEEIIASLRNSFILHVSMGLFYDVCKAAESLSWARDMFDRLIVAEAICAGNIPLITSDTRIHEHYKKAVW